MKTKPKAKPPSLSLHIRVPIDDIASLVSFLIAADNRPAKLNQTGYLAIRTMIALTRKERSFESQEAVDYLEGIFAPKALPKLFDEIKHQLAIQSGKVYELEGDEKLTVTVED